MGNRTRRLAVGVTALSVVTCLATATAAGMLSGTQTSGESINQAIPKVGDQTNALTALDSAVAQFGPSSTVATGVGTERVTKSVNGRTVADALAAAGIKPDADDLVSLPLNTKLVDGQQVEFTKVDAKTFSKKSVLEFPKEMKESSSLAKGETKVQTKGVNGTAVETYQSIFHNGKLFANVLVKSDVIAMPVTEVTLVGTRSKQTSRSSERPPASNPSQENLTPAAGSSCKASYYWQGQMTANGERFNPNDLTAAHKTLPFGARVKVTNPSNGKTVIVRINDRGPYIAGRCLDLSRASMQLIGGTGAGVITVTYQIL